MVVGETPEVSNLAVGGLRIWWCGAAAHVSTSVRAGRAGGHKAWDVSPGRAAVRGAQGLGVLMQFGGSFLGNKAEE